MAFLTEYGIFLAKVITLVVAILFVIATIASLKAKAKREPKGSLVLKKINDHYEAIEQQIKSELLSKKEWKQEKKSSKRNKPKNTQPKPALFVLNFHGDVRASAIHALRREITALLLVAKPTDRILLKLESGGGVVNAYGLAASQLERLKTANLPLTIAIDKVAASGGYMMACVANEIIAAPFAVVGSIGVVAQLPNVHKLLEKNNIEFEQITAGEYKRTLTVFGENTKEGRRKVQAEVNEMHHLFKDFIKQHRQQVNIESVATGEHWFAIQTIEKALVDKIQTSDDYLLSHKDTHTIYSVQYRIKKTFTERFGHYTQLAVDRLFGSYVA